MSTRELPSRPSLAQLKLQAKELRRDQAEGKPSAVARIRAHEPRRPEATPAARSDRPLTLTQAQLVIAREYGFQSWGRLKHYIELGSRLAAYAPHPGFGEALAAFDAGDLERFGALVASDPTLLRARTHLDPPYGYFTGATLLHHVAGNPGRDSPLPGNVVALAELLLQRGADVNAETLGPNGGTTMGLLITSHQASQRDLTGPLMELLLRYGATLQLDAPDALDAPLSNHAPRAAERMIALGARPDILAAAALGRMDLLRASFDGDGRLRSRPRRHGRRLSERDAIGLATLFAYVNRHHEAVDWLLEKDGNWDITGVNNGTALHRAAWAGDLAMIERLIARGADITNRDNPFHSTPLSWAQHNRQDAAVQWMRSHCAIDLHDAVCLDLREHVEARLREEPASVNRLRDQWEIPRCAPLHWAAWPRYEDVAGTHSHDPTRREQLVGLLLDHGADPNLVAGNGLTAVDIARAAQALGIVAILARYGGKRVVEL